MKARLANVLGSIAVLAWLLGAGKSLPAQTAATIANSGPAQTEGESAVVTEVRIVTEDGKTLSLPKGGIPLQTGKPLDRDKVAESLHALYGTGDYANLRAVAVPVAGGIRVDFVAREQLFFNRVIFRGLTAPPSEAAAGAAMEVVLGHPFREDVMNEGVERLRQILNEEGLYTAKVTAEKFPHEPTHEMDIVVHVQPGPRAVIASVHTSNGTEYPDAMIASKFRLKPGQKITQEKIRHATERIRKFLVKRGHLNARAVVHRGAYDAAKNNIPLELEVTEGPRVQLEVTGAKLSQGQIKRLVPIYQEGAVDADLLEEGKRNIQQRMESDGYFDAKVSYGTSTREAEQKGAGKATEEVITYHVDRGDRHRLVGYDLAGNHYFSNSLLRSRIQITPPGFGVKSRFNQRLLDADQDSLRALYQANGYLEAKITVKTVDDYKGKRGNLFVHFTVEEGPQARVTSLDIQGNQALKTDELLGVVGSSPGQPYSDFNVASDRDNVLALYYNEGFPDARFTATANREQGDREKVRVVFHIEEGPQILVKRVLVTGYEHTRRGIIARQVQVKRNRPLRQSEVVESQRRLYNLGVFNRVTIEPQNPDGSDPDKDIVVLVEEAKRYTIAYGGGFEVQRLGSTTNPAASEIQAAPRGIFEVSKLNLTGRGDSLSLKIRGSTIEDRGLLGYLDPNILGNRHLSFQATAYTEKTQDINTFTEMRYEASVQLNDQIKRRTTLSYRYVFRKVLVSNLNIPAQEVPLFSAPTLVSEFGVTWARDARNNAADATKGTFNSADFSIADTTIGSSASFWRLFYQNSSYHPIGKKLNFARSVRFGILEPFHDTASLSFPAITTTPLPPLIPLPERFFAGGGESLRGFALNQAGPRDPITGFPVGGQALLIFNQELRFPMKLPFIGTALSGALFYDGGNVYSRLGRISFGTSPPKPIFTPANPLQCQSNCTNELSYFSHTVGLGLRYATPVGPIRIDLGYQLNRPYFVFPLPCPVNMPTCAAGSQGFQRARLPGFQIFFNLGSTF